MASLPIRRGQFDLPQFAAWLAQNGAEVGVPTNPYEVIRYRAYVAGSAKASTHVVYAKENGLLNFQGLSREHYAAFLDGWSVTLHSIAKEGGTFLVTEPEPKRPKSVVTREALLRRDGDECWFCGSPLRGDATIEHLVPKSKGGLNGLANYVLAHKRCNARAADMPLVAKIELRARLRDSDEHPQGEDPKGLSGEAMPARAAEGGIAQTPDATPGDHPCD